MNLPALNFHNAILDPAALHGPSCVDTTTLLPDGGLVRVVVRPNGNGFDVGDDGLGLEVAFGVGVQKPSLRAMERARDLAQTYGLEFDGSAFRARNVRAEELQSAIVYVADACRSLASWLIDASSGELAYEPSDKPPAVVEHDRVVSTPIPLLRQQTEQKLRKIFSRTSVQPQVFEIGRSGARHKFDFLVGTPSGHLLFAVVKPVTYSINSIYTKFGDASLPKPNRHAVIEDDTGWKEIDLRLISTVAEVRALSRPWTDLERLTA